MAYEPAVAMLHEMEGTTSLLNVYMREDQSSKNAAKINENAYRALKTMQAHSPAYDAIVEAVPDFDWSISVGGKQ